MKNISIDIVICFMCLLCIGCSVKKQEFEIIDLTTNDKVNPIGIENQVYFSWKMHSEKEGQKQTAYQIFVSESEEGLANQQYIWNSEKVESEKSVAIPYTGNALEAEQGYVWKVKVWNHEDKSVFSKEAYFELGKEGNSWEDTSWIVAPKRTDYVREHASSRNGVSEVLKSNYDMSEEVSQISYEFKMDETETGLLWGAKEGAYGPHYLWHFRAEDGCVELMIEKKEENEIKEVKENIVLPLDMEVFLADVHHVDINIVDGKAFTYLDGSLISSDIKVENQEIGCIGLWVERSEKKAWYDNICIRNSGGEILVEENFEADTNIFVPYYLKVEGGRARADSGFVVTGGGENPAPMFRKVFEISREKKVEAARLYAAALGSYDIYMNGIDINPYYMAPGQSVYNEEVYYRTYDVTEYVQSGENALGIILGHGRYDRAKGTWGDQTALYAQLVISYEDGTRQVVGTDETWSVCIDGPVRNDDLFSGEYFDANYVQEDWSKADYLEDEDKGWTRAKTYSLQEELALTPVPDEGVKCVDVLTPVSVIEPVEGVYVYDFGRNFNGACRLQVSGKVGDIITMRYGEYLNTEMLQRKDDEIGTIWTRNLATADNTDYYIFAEDGEATYSPTFSYRGFRYLQVTGIEEALPLEAVEGLVISSDNTRTGYFECSDEDMNQLYETIYWSQLSNYVDTPTDCPQRDERLGWTGDAQVFSYTGALNANTANFMYKYIDAFRVSQLNDGSYQEIVPFYDKISGSNGWSDAGVILVWEMYQQYENELVIKENLQAMCRYVDYLVSTSDNFIRNVAGYNDHNAVSYTDLSFCNTSQCVYVAGLVARMCEIVGEQELAAQYNDIYQQYLSTWRATYLGEDGSIGGWLQSEYAMALAYELYPKELEASGAEKLNISVETGGHRITTGYVSTPHLLPMLCKYGYVDAAYKLIQQTGYPSWNYMLEYTSALSEAWNTFRINDAGEVDIRGSLNHVALGSVGQWFYTDVLGIQRDEIQPGYKHFYLEPKVGGGLTWAKGSYESVYGTIESSWEVTEDGVKYRFVVPANTTATLTLPDEEYQGVVLEAGVHEFVVERE